jgi:hypothetical protein
LFGLINTATGEFAKPLPEYPSGFVITYETSPLGTVIFIALSGIPIEEVCEKAARLINKRNAVSVFFIFKILSFTNSLDVKNCRLVASKLAHNGCGFLLAGRIEAVSCPTTTKLNKRTALSYKPSAPLVESRNRYGQGLLLFFMNSFVLF